jgi:hypothetical protein
MKHRHFFGLVVSILFLLPGCFWAREDQKFDLIVFSYNRPLQLYAFLESTQTYLTGLGSTIVIYRSGDAAFHEAYGQVCKAFPWAQFWEQGASPSTDFKPLTMRAIAQLPSDYLMFAVDDIVVKDRADCSQCVKALEHTGAYGFYLRLGSNLTDCYACSAKQPMPVFDYVENDVLSWTLGRAAYDWGYPNTVDMTIYRKADVLRDFNSFAFTNPNLLEGNWSSFGGRVAQRKGLCFHETKMVNLPLNRVQKVWANRNMESFTPQELLAFFNQGLKMDIRPLYAIKNPGAHMEYTPAFIVR